MYVNKREAKCTLLIVRHLLLFCSLYFKKISVIVSESFPSALAIGNILKPILQKLLYYTLCRPQCCVSFKLS